MGAGARAPAGGRGRVPDLPRRGRRPEHLLHPGLRALRRRSLRDGRRGRQPAPLQVHLPQPRRDHEDRADARHAPGDAGVPRHLARGRRRPPSASRTRWSHRTTSSRGDGASTRSWPAASGSSRSTRSACCCTTRGSSRPPGKYKLTIWPYHAMLGGIGHALVPAVEEAIFFHSVARRSQPDFQQKGHSPLTEHYSVLGPEVTRGPDDELLGAAQHGAARGAAELRRGRDRGAGEEPLRRLDDRRPPARRTFAPSDGSRRRSTCSRTAPRPSSSPARSTTPRRRTPPSSGSRPPACTSCARPTRSRTGREWPPRPAPEAYSTRASRGLSRKRRPTFAEGRPSVITMSPVKSFSPRISAEPTP